MMGRIAVPDRGIAADVEIVAATGGVMGVVVVIEVTAGGVMMIAVTEEMIDPAETIVVNDDGLVPVLPVATLVRQRHLDREGEVPIDNGRLRLRCPKNPIGVIPTLPNRTANYNRK